MRCTAFTWCITFLYPRPAAKDLLRSRLLSRRQGNVSGAYTFKGKAVSDALINDPAQFLSHSNTCIACGERGKGRDRVREFMRPGEQLLRGYYFIDHAPLFCGFCIQDLAGEEKI